MYHYLFLDFTVSHIVINALHHIISNHVVAGLGVQRHYADNFATMSYRAIFSPILNKGTTMSLDHAVPSPVYPTGTFSIHLFMPARALFAGFHAERLSQRIYGSNAVLV